VGLTKIYVFISFFFLTSINVLHAQKCPQAIEQLAEKGKTPEKIYVLDTNILHSDPEALDTLADKHVIIPRTVIKELDRHKSERNSDRSFTARKASARIAEISEKYESQNFIPLEGGGDLTFAEVSENFKWPSGFDPEKPDDRIVALALEIQRANPNYKVVVLTRDNNAAILSRSVGLLAQKLSVKVNPEVVREIFDGPVVVKATNEQLAKLPEKAMTLDEATQWGLSKDAELFENQFVLFEPSTREENFDLKVELTRVWRYRKSKDGKPLLIPVRRNEIASLVISPLNVDQIMAFELLLDPRVDLVSLSGKAGTGKTLLTLVAGLVQSPLISSKSHFEQIILTRPNQVTGADMGFLPGTLKEKMDPFLGPFEDNFRVIIEALRDERHSESFINSVLPHRKGSHGSLGKGLSYDDIVNQRNSVKSIVDKIKDSDFFSVQAIAYSRGRSWKNTLLIVDEAQNLSLHEVKTILTRAGEGTKVVLLGDVFQIDNRSLNQTNNGLMIAASRFRGKHLAGHVNLRIGERSDLASMASELLDQ
jgi:PhoH-like ATPase